MLDINKETVYNKVQLLKAIVEKSISKNIKNEKDLQKWETYCGKYCDYHSKF